MAKRTSVSQGQGCPDCGLPLRPIPSGWWCQNGDHDAVALSGATERRDGDRVIREVPSLRVEGPGKNLWRTYELEAYR